MTSLADPMTLSQLRADYPDRVVGPDDGDYDAARLVFPGGIDIRPELDFMQAEYLGHGNPLLGRNHSWQSYCMPTYRHKTEASQTRGKTFR